MLASCASQNLAFLPDGKMRVTKKRSAQLRAATWSTAISPLPRPIDEAARGLTEVTVIFRACPALPQSYGQVRAGIAIARDRNVFVTIGDRSGSPHGMSCGTWTLALAKPFISSRNGADAPQSIHWRGAALYQKLGPIRGSLNGLPAAISRLRDN